MNEKMGGYMTLCVIIMVLFILIVRVELSNRIDKIEQAVATQPMEVGK